MLEFVFIAIGGIIVTLLLLAPNMKGGGIQIQENRILLKRTHLSHFSQTMRVVQWNMNTDSRVHIQECCKIEAGTKLEKAKIRNIVNFVARL